MMDQSFAILRKTTLVIIDDHPLFRQGVEDLLRLETDLQIVGRASTAQEGLALIRKLRPHLGITDINLPDLDGLTLVRFVAQEQLPTRMLLLTAYDDPDQQKSALRNGAWGYCTKDIQPAELVRCIRAIAQGYHLVFNQVLNQDEFKAWLDYQAEEIDDRHQGNDHDALFLLSPREIEVLSLLAQGKSNKEIANCIGISHQTVKNHITSLFRKIGVEDRTQAVLIAIQRGWIRMQSMESKE